VLIRNQDTGLSLPRAPEFGFDGAWPPVAIDWVPLSWALFLADPSDRDPDSVAGTALSHKLASGLLLRTEDVLGDDFLCTDIIEILQRRRTRALMRKLLGKRAAKISEDLEGIPDSPAAHGELRRVVRSTRWRRKDSVTQLPPGATYEMTHSVTTGLSVEHSQTLADSLGLSLGGNLLGIQATLSRQLQQEFGLKLDITSQEERSTTLTLTNPSDTLYRVFALWHVDQRISVDALTVSTGRHRSEHMPAWEPRGSPEFVVDSDPHLTFAEIDRT
jgi:hypothetical protein